MKTRTKFKILVVDDERSGIETLTHIFRSKYTVLVAKDGETALKIARTAEPDLILLDVILQGMSGFDVLTKLKSSSDTHKIPVIFVTSLNRPEDEKRGFMLGAVDYITKPFHRTTVEARVKTHIQTAAHIRMIEDMCMLDALTNLPNRRGFDNNINIEWTRAKRCRSPLCLLMIDIDGFKDYNDKYGHPQGDTLLVSLTSIFERALMRPADFIARWGGEEFAALLPETSLSGALRVAERLRASVERSVIKCADGTETRITISIGVNCVNPDNEKTVDEFISDTDKALYKAKADGKNAVRVAKSPEKERKPVGTSPDA